MRLKVYLVACFFLICICRTMASLPPGCDCAEDEYVHPSCAMTACPFEDYQPDMTPCCVLDTSDRVPINGNMIWMTSAGFILGISFLIYKKKSIK